VNEERKGRNCHRERKEHREEQTNFKLNGIDRDKMIFEEFRGGAQGRFCRGNRFGVHSPRPSCAEREWENRRPLESNRTQSLSWSVSDGGGHHFEDSPEAVVAAEAAFVEGCLGNRAPLVAGVVVVGGLGQTGQFEVVLRIVAAQFVDHQVQRGDDENSEAARARFVKGVSRRAGDVAVGIIFEHQAEGAMGIERRGLAAQRNIVRRHQLFVTPAALMQEAVAKSKSVGRVQGNAACAIGVRHEEISAMQTITPGSPTHRLAQALVDVVGQFHPGDVAQHDGRNVRRGRRIGITGAGIGPQNSADRRHIQIVNILAADRIERNDATVDEARAGAFAVIAGGHAEELTQRNIGFPGIVQRKCLGQIRLRKHFLREPVGNFVAKFLEHDSARDARDRLTGGGHVGIGVALGASEIFFVGQISVPHYQQSAVLAATLSKFKGAIQLGKIQASLLPDLGGVMHLAPASFTVGFGKIIGGAP
jgi:hypothetical protein